MRIHNQGGNGWRWAKDGSKCVAWGVGQKNINHPDDPIGVRFCVFFFLGWKANTDTQIIYGIFIPQIGKDQYIM